MVKLKNSKPKMTAQKTLSQKKSQPNFEFLWEAKLNSGRPRTKNYENW